MWPMEMMMMGMGSHPILIEFTLRGGGKPRHREEGKPVILDCSTLSKVEPLTDGATIFLRNRDGVDVPYQVSETYPEIKRILRDNYLFGRRTETPRFKVKDLAEIQYVPRNHKELEAGTRGTIVSVVYESVYEVDFGEGHGIIAVSGENLKRAKTDEKVEAPEPALP